VGSAGPREKGGSGPAPPRVGFQTLGKSGPGAISAWGANPGKRPGRWASKRGLKDWNLLPRGRSVECSSDPELGWRAHQDVCCNIPCLYLRVFRGQKFGISKTFMNYLNLRMLLDFN
jgi:hypothetical protein